MTAATTSRHDDLTALHAIVRLAGQQALYPANLLVWTLNWSMPIVLGIIAQRYFDGLQGVGGWPLEGVITALVVYGVVRLLGIAVGMPLAARVVFVGGAIVRRNMLRWLLGLPGAQPVRLQTGEVVSRFRDDVEHTENFLDGTVDFAGSVVSAVVSFVLLAAISLRWALAAFVPIVLVFVVVLALGDRIRVAREAARDHTEAVTGFLGEAFGAAQAVKLTAAERPLLRRLARLNDDRRQAMVRDKVLSTATRELGTTSGTVALGVMLVLAANSLGSDGPDALTVGQFALFASLLGRAAHAAFFVAWVVAELRQTGVSVRRMLAMLDGADVRDLTARARLSEPMPTSRAVDLPPPDPSAPILELRGVRHRHADSNAAIHDVDLVVGEGELVVVTGRIGAGKTTLLQLVLGLLPIEGGKILWRGTVLDEVAAAMVPPRSAYTPQVPRLLSSSLRDAVLLGHVGDDADVLEALDTARMKEDLEAMADGLDTLVGTRGLRLSGGQVQRTAAARMLVRRPELLVVDDVSSALDVETESQLWARLRDDGTTALVVSTRRPALSRADRVVLLEDGRVQDVGTAEELLSRSSSFRELWG